MPLDPNEPLSVVLTAQQWNMVLAVLHEGSYRVVAPLIQAISTQCLAQEPHEANNVVPIAGE